MVHLRAVLTLWLDDGVHWVEGGRGTDWRGKRVQK